MTNSVLNRDHSWKPESDFRPLWISRILVTLTSSIVNVIEITSYAGARTSSTLSQFNNITKYLQLTHNHLVWE